MLTKHTHTQTHTCTHAHSHLRAHAYTHNMRPSCCLSLVFKTVWKVAVAWLVWGMGRGRGRGNQATNSYYSLISGRCIFSSWNNMILLVLSCCISVFHPCWHIYSRDASEPHSAYWQLTESKTSRYTSPSRLEMTYLTKTRTKCCWNNIFHLYMSLRIS